MEKIIPDNDRSFPFITLRISGYYFSFGKFCVLFPNRTFRGLASACSICCVIYVKYGFAIWDTIPIYMQDIVMVMRRKEEYKKEGGNENLAWQHQT